MSKTKIHGVPPQKGPYLEFPKGDSWGFCFGGSTYLYETFCKVSALPYFFPTKNLFRPDYSWCESVTLCPVKNVFFSHDISRYKSMKTRLLFYVNFFSPVACTKDH